MAKQTEIRPLDYVSLKPLGRSAKIQKEPEILKVVKRGEMGSKFQGKLLLTSNDIPPKTWWEAENNCGIYRAHKERRDNDAEDEEHSHEDNEEHEHTDH